jgi:DNA-binding MarR family transcriptional regulator
MKNLSTATSFGFNVRRAHRAFDRLLHAFLMPHGIKTGFWYFLRVLWARDGQTQRELSVANNVTENTTAAMINGMMKEGLVTRLRDPEDKRKWIVTLTPHGSQLRHELLPYAKKVNEIAVQGIAKSDLAVCLSVLKRMSANLEWELRALHADQV